MNFKRRQALLSLLRANHQDQCLQISAFPKPNGKEQTGKEEERLVDITAEQLHRPALDLSLISSCIRCGRVGWVLDILFWPPHICIDAHICAHITHAYKYNQVRAEEKKRNKIPITNCHPKVICLNIRISNLLYLHVS